MSIADCGLRMADSSATARLAASSARAAEVKRRIGEFAGGVLLAPALQEMQKSPFKTKYSSGGHGEDVFAGQLALELSKKIGRASENGFGKRLYEAALRQMNARGSAS